MTWFVGTRNKILRQVRMNTELQRMAWLQLILMLTLPIVLWLQGNLPVFLLGVVVTLGVQQSIWIIVGNPEKVIEHTFLWLKKLTSQK